MMHANTWCVIFLCCCVTYVSADMLALNALDYRFAIVLEKDFARRQLSEFEGGADFDTLAELRRMWAILAKQQLGNLPLKVEFHSRPDVILRKDLTAVLLVASCNTMWRLYNNSDDAGRLLYMAITDEDCARLPLNEGVTVPMVSRGMEVSQILSDLRASSELSWPSMLLIYDATLAPERLSSVIKALTEPQPNIRYAMPKVHLLDLGYFTSKEKELITQFIREYKGLNRISSFLVITSRENLYVVMEAAKSIGLVHPLTQWLYTLTESEYYVSQNDSTLVSLLHEGDNVALLINSTRHTSDVNSCTEGGVLCYAHELLRALVAALASGAATEQEMLSRVSEDEWELESLDAEIRRQVLLDHIKVGIQDMKRFDSLQDEYGRDTERGREIIRRRRKVLLNHIQEGISHELERTCDGCVAWRIRAGITWGMKGPAGMTGVENATIIDTGIWRPGSGVVMMEPLFPHITNGFRGKQLTVVSCHAPPWHEISFNDTGYMTHFTGFIFDVLDELGSRLNFTYKVVFPANTVRGFAAEGRDPTLDDFQGAADERSPIWEQMIDLVQQNRVFLAAAAISMSAGREMRVNFTSALASQPHAFLIAKPRQMSRTLLFLTPFTTNAWLSIFAAAMVVGPILYVVHRANPMNNERELEMFPSNEKLPATGLNKFINCIWYVYGALLQQGAMHMPSADSARLVVGMWWLVVLVVVTSYCGNLVAFLTFPRMEPPVTTLLGLQRMRGRLSWGLLRGSGLENLLEVLHDKTEQSQRFSLFTRDSSVPEYTKLLNAAERHADIDEELLYRVEYEGHVLLERRSRLISLQSTQLKTQGYCAYAISNDDFLPEQIGLAMPLQTPYITLVNNEIRRMQQAGLVDMWLRSAMPRRDRCWVTPQTLATEVNSHSVNLDDMQGSFILLGMGLFAAIFMIIMEKCLKCFIVMKGRGIIQPFIN